MEFKCKVGDQHLTADGLSSQRFSTTAGLVIISAPAAVIAALGLTPGAAMKLTIATAPDEV